MKIPLKYSLSLLTVFFNVQLAHSQGISIYKVILDSSIAFYADNRNYCPYQCRLTISEDFLVINRGANTDSSLYFIVPPQTQKLYLFTVQARYPSRQDIGYVEECQLGNPQTARHQDSTTYRLPYLARQKYRVIQGYNGLYSHRGQYALDFRMSIGTPICASRGGVVVKVKNDSNEGGADRQYSSKANQIVIYHSDGTFAVYLHLQYEGTLVKVGDTVRIGQVIGYSGNTGWSSTPHLHYEVRQPTHLDYKTIPTKFWVSPTRRKTLRFLNKPKAR
ncbi:MAG: M23 family metallopeptidase [Microscillaceae bacterium]|jgi:murein DD-endopeptidase MepM/ murein hydrolase activator NlpD|nr:M23 family metallopeptidase [Microscillaceae bacterium]